MSRDEVGNHILVPKGAVGCHGVLPFPIGAAGTHHAGGRRNEHPMAGHTSLHHALGQGWIPPWVGVIQPCSFQVPSPGTWPENLSVRLPRSTGG